MNEPFEPTDRHDDFAAGWLLAWKAVLSTGTAVPDVSQVDLPPELGDRLRGSAECLRRLHEVWPARNAFTAAEPGAAPEPDSSAHPPIGRFQVRRELGRGGFGVVYLAHDPVLNRDVAVKVPYAGFGLDPSSGHRLAVEAQAAARLGHPNIVPVHECGTVDGVTYVVSAYCPGISLADWLQRTDQAVPWQDAARVVAALARAVHHAHARGVLHRDLKPANVLLALAEPGAPCSPTDTLPLTDYVPRVADFGMAKVLVDSSVPHTATGVIRGTPAYMAPEQATGHQRDITTAVDVYALGAVLYELLVRRPPFAGDTPLAILDKVRVEPPTSLRAIRAGLPADLETTCLTCLDKDPARRYRSAEALAADLDRVLLGEPILARRPSRLERIGRAIRRHPAVAGLSALLLLALVAGLIATGRQLQQTRQERDRAEHHLAQLLEVSERTAITTADDLEYPTDDVRPLRQKLLTESAEWFAALASELSDYPAERWRRARCHLHLSALLFNLDRTDESRAAAAQAVEAFEVIVREHPHDPDAVLGLTSSLIRLACAEPDDVRRRETADRAQAAYTAYLARGPVDRREAGFATFEYDLAVMASARSDRESASLYLASACERLRPLIAPGSESRSQIAPVAAHVLTFRCQIERFSGRPRAAAAADAGREALALATETCQERPGDHRSWKALGSAYLEYGLALQAAGENDRALEVWKDGYKRLGEEGARRSAGGVASVIVRQSYTRLMLAHNLGLGYGGQRPSESERWYRAGLDLARQLLFVSPSDRQFWYMHGMCCVNLVELERPRNLPADRLALHGEGIGSLETALRMGPDSHQLRSDLGLCWHRYSTDLLASGHPVAALAALVRAIGHQSAAVTLAPNQSTYRHQLRFYVARSAALITSLGSSTTTPTLLPRAVVIDE